MTSHFADLGFWATDSMTSGPPPAGAQGFSMSTEEMRELLKTAETMLETIAAQIRPAQRLAQVVAPADEPASQAAVHAPNGVNDTGKYYIGHLQFQQQYLSEMIARMRNALGLTAAADEHAADTTKSIGIAE